MSGSSGSGAMRAAFREQMKTVYTSVPGHVIALIDGGVNQRAQIQVGIERVDINGASFALPTIIDVPIHFPGGDYCVEYEIKPLCEGMIFFSQRCADSWKVTGGIAQNPVGRMHDLQDAFFVPGFRSENNKMLSFQNNGIRLRNKAGSQFAWLKNDGSIVVENGAGFIRLMANGNVNINGVIIEPNSLITTPNNLVTGSVNMNTHKHTGVQTGPSNTGGPTS